MTALQARVERMLAERRPAAVAVPMLPQAVLWQRRRWGWLLEHGGWRLEARAAILGGCALWRADYHAGRLLASGTADDAPAAMAAAQGFAGFGWPPEVEAGDRGHA